MGCSSSNGANASNPGSAKKKGVLPQTINWLYFQGGGRGDPLTQMFEYHGQPHSKQGVGFAQWPAMKPTEGGEMGGMPIVKVNMNGKEMRFQQLGAIMRMFGIKFGYYNPKDWKTARLIDPIVDTFGDVINSMGAAAMSPPEQQAAKMEACIAQFKKIMGLMEATLKFHGGKFACGNMVSIADFCMISLIENGVYNMGGPFGGALQGANVLSGCPKTEAYVKCIRDEFKNHNSKRPPIGPL